MREADAKLRREVVLGKEAFDAVMFLPFDVVNEDRGRPLRAEAWKCVGLFADVKSRGCEIRFNELLYVGVAVNLGIQPSATRSHRRRGKIEQERLPALGRFLQRLIGVTNPFDLHEVPPAFTEMQEALHSRPHTRPLSLA